MGLEASNTSLDTFLVEGGIGIVCPSALGGVWTCWGANGVVLVVS